MRAKRSQTPAPAALVAPPALRQNIVQAFSLEELRFLCDDLEIKYEELRGESLSAKAQALTDYCKRHNRLPELLAYLQRERPHMQWAAPASTPLSTRSRENLLNNIQHKWIDGFLKQSLHHEIELIVGFRPDAVGQLVLKQIGQPDQVVTREHLPEIFKASGRNLLILGEPGSGKTITLLQLAKSLLAEARQDPKEPMPVILNLSPWAQRQQSLAEWLVEELLLQYGLPRDFTRTGIAHNHFRYLLDGLDEVAPDARDACTAAINDFKAEYPAEMVVCCRVVEYEALPQDLYLGSAIEIRPLNDEQIQDYLSKPELELQAVQATLAHDPGLRELAASPLTLSLMTLAYRGMTWEQLRPLASKEARRHHLFDCYVAQMFERRPLLEESSYTKPQALSWSAKLAQRMEQRKQTIFYIERLQPTWLPLALQSRYQWIVGLLFGLLVGLLLGLPLGLYAGLFVGLLFGLLFGLLAERIELVEEVTWRSPSFQVLWSAIKPWLLVGQLIGLLAVLLGGALQLIELDSGFRRPPYELELSGLTFRLLVVLLVGLTFGLLSLLPIGLLVGLPTFIQGREISRRLQPNQGVWRSGRNGLRAFPLFGLTFGLLGGLFGWLFFDLLSGLLVGLLLGLLVALLNYGGRAWLQHYVLRWMLARAGVLPPFSWRDGPFIEFLDAMHDRILLRRVGGGWVFIHRTLQEYFAEQAVEDDKVRG